MSMCPRCWGPWTGYVGSEMCLACFAREEHAACSPCRCVACAQARIVLERIASAAPSLHRNGPTDHTCSLCAAHIDEARAALGWAPLPAAPRTSVAPQTTP